MRAIQHWVNGAYFDSADRAVDILNPATGQKTGEVGIADEEDVAVAIGAAVQAFTSWSQTSLSQRAKILFEFRNLFQRRSQDIAEIVTEEHGKVLTDALGEVQRGLEIVEYACGIPTLLKGEYSDQVSSSVDSFSLRQPIGVVAGVTPFNFPVMVPAWMYPIAIACGNAFVLKPSERDPSASNLIAELWAEAGLPDGVFSVVHGDKNTVDAILNHPDVAAVSFVGSTPVARHIHERASASGKRVQALGGAKNHAIVLPDADLNYVANQLSSAAFGSAGERCMAVSAAVAVGSAGDGLLEALNESARAVRVGPGWDPSSEMGPVVAAASRDRIHGLIDSAEEQGASIAVDGRGINVPGYEEGFWVGPTVVDLVVPDMDIYTHEVFGPVLSVLRADSVNTAIELINANPYGNGTAIFTNDGHAARHFMRSVQVGMVGINVPIPVPMAFHSFGGWKDSLFGDLHVHGPEGVAFYTRNKVVTSRWPSRGESQSLSLDMPTAN